MVGTAAAGDGLRTARGVGVGGRVAVQTAAARSALRGELDGRWGDVG